MTKKEFRALWAVPIDIDARRRRIKRMQAMLDDAPVVVDTVQASSDAPAYGMHTVKITGIDTAGGLRNARCWQSCKLTCSSETNSTGQTMHRRWSL